MKSPYEENQIEKMARVIEVTEQIARDAHCGLPSPRMYATDLFEKGCRMQSPNTAEIVRCQNCEFHHWEQEPCHGRTIHRCSVLKAEVFRDFYCYYGKQKTQADELPTASNLKDQPMVEKDLDATIHGEWIVNQAGFIICSECKTLGTKSWKRCPVCEAKMDGKIGNNNNRKGELPF